MLKPKRPLYWMVSFLVLSCVSVSNAQRIDSNPPGNYPGQQQSDAAASSRGYGITTPGQANGADNLHSGFVPYMLPDLFMGHFAGSFSLIGADQKGALDSIVSDPNRVFVYTSASGALSFEERKRRSDTILEYSVAPRAYTPIHRIDVVGQDAGVTERFAIGTDTQLSFNYRYSRTPDFANSLMSESIAQQSSFTNPSPIITATPLLVSQPTALLSPADGLVSLRSLESTNSGSMSFNHKLTPRTSLSLQAVYSGIRFDDSRLFGSDQYLVSGQIGYMLTPKTSVGFGYQGGRMDLTDASQRTLNQNVSIFISRQLGHYTILTFSIGPTLITTQGQQNIQLPPLLVNLLGRSSLTRTTISRQINWLGAGTSSFHFGTYFHRVNIGFNYTGGVNNSTASAGLGGALFSQDGSISLSKEFWRRTRVTVEVSYVHSKYLGLINAVNVDQEGASASIVHRVSQSVDFSTYFQYSKTLARNGGLSYLNNQQLGARLTYQFPRTRGEGRF